MKTSNPKNPQKSVMHGNDDSKAEKAFLDGLELPPDADFDKLFRKINANFMPVVILRQRFIDEHTEGRAFSAYLWLRNQDLSQLPSYNKHITQKEIKDVAAFIKKVKKMLAK